MKNLYFILLLLVVNGCKKSEDGKVEVVPLAPTELKATVISKDQVDLTWKDNSSNETGFKIERKTDSGNFTEIGSTAADLTTFSDKTVSLNTNYTYRVHSFNQVGKSVNYSNEVSLKTINVPTLFTSRIDLVSSGAQSGGDITSDGGSAITARGVVWDTKPNPTIALSTKTNDIGTGLGAYMSNITGLTANTLYYVRSYATNSAGTGYGNELTFNAILVPTLTTTEITNITPSDAESGGTISSNGGTNIFSVKGVVWSTNSNPNIGLSTKTNDGSGAGAFKSSIKGLKANTKYYVRAYATNIAGTGYGNELSFTTSENFVFGTVTSATGRIWMDRNLGASRVATSSTDVEAYGDYYQWGRGADGHQKGTSAITNVLSQTDVPQNSSFITTNKLPRDWRSTPNNNLWQGVNGINNPCPSGFRLPTIKEWEEEVATWSKKNRIGAFESNLKLPLSGYRDSEKGNLSVGAGGRYWSSTTVRDINLNDFSDYFDFANNFVFVGLAPRSEGNCVRCIKN
ncbi:fibronectin type III domain-containing protein [Daejeonella sp.]|jgi:uncharacterized protein (TIGR02145 family)|uniref:fibronectin type III domain-containing protein n=1 Tax=Daejeonella sp. TaxID=2805397 RepID=UPI0037C05862